IEGKVTIRANLSILGIHESAPEVRGNRILHHRPGIKHGTKRAGHAKVDRISLSAGVQASAWALAGSRVRSVARVPCATGHEGQKTPFMEQNQEGDRKMRGRKVKEH